MASDFRKFAGYTLEELEELRPNVYNDNRYCAISFRPSEIKQVFISRNPKCKYIGIEYWDGEIVITDGRTMTPVMFDDLYFDLA